MRITVPLRSLGNPRVTFSRLGYHAATNGSFERRMGGGVFPRFHAYIGTQNDTAIINLHLDMKAHSYTGVSAHSGEYDTDIVKRELVRIQEELSRSPLV